MEISATMEWPFSASVLLPYRGMSSACVRVYTIIVYTCIILYRGRIVNIHSAKARPTPREGVTHAIFKHSTMKNLFHLVAVFVLIYRGQSSPETESCESGDDTCQMTKDTFTMKKYRPGSGVPECDRTAIKSDDDYISMKFFQDHICLMRNTPPEAKSAFCQNFRKDLDLYHVMILSRYDLDSLRKDLQGHQDELKKEDEKFLPKKKPPHYIHFYTDDTYNFIECSLKKGKWKAKKLNGYYQPYIPRRAPGSSVYQIYHGCKPESYLIWHPGFSSHGNC